MRGGARVRALSSVLTHALRLVWQSGPTRVALLFAVQLFAALALAASVVLVNSVLDAALRVARDEAPIGSAVLPVVLLAAVTAATAVLLGVSNLQLRVLGALVERAVWREVLTVTTSVDLRTYDDPDFYDQASRVEDRASWQTRAVVEALVVLAGDGLGIVAGIVALATISPPLAPLLLLAGVPLLVTSRLAGRREFAFALAQSWPYRERDYLQDVLTHRDEAKEVRAFSLAPALRHSWESRYAAYIDDLRRHVGRLVTLTVAGGLAAAALTGAGMVVAILLVARGVLGVAEAGAALVAVRLLAARVSGASRAVSQLFEASLFLEDLDEFRRRIPASPEGPPRCPAPEMFEELAACDLTFTYPDSPRPAIDRVSLRLRRGEVVALVGENGSGKTTLAKLLAQLYSPDAGHITWDGVDVREYSPETVRARMAILFQDFIRYRLTAHTNVALGAAHRHPGPDEIKTATLAADADGFLSALPAGYETVLSKEFPGGTDLSLGQWQRVALSRALLRDAPLVLLDEPSSSLDARAEYEFFQRVRSTFAGRTLLVISHRLSTVRSADRIYVLDDGRVVEEGSHIELMDRGGLYSRLFRLQAQGYANEGAPPEE